ncbi:MAG: glycosyltransferase family 1 protein [Spirochaetota bacterium]
MFIRNILNIDSIKTSNTKNKKIKVAMFTDVLKENIDGVSNTIFNFLRHIKGSNYEFLFITPYPPENSFGYKVLQCPYITFPLNKTYRLGLPQISKTLKQEIDNFSPDLIHFTTPSFLGKYAVQYAKFNNLPLIGTYHTHFAAYIKYYFRFSFMLSAFIQTIVWKIILWFYNQCDAALVPTRPIRDEMVDAGIDEKRLFIWGRGVDYSLYNPAKRDTGYMEGITGKDKKSILFVSRIVMEKDLKTLIEINNYLKKERNDVVLVVTGDGPKLNYLKKKMPGAVFTGNLIKDDLARIYASSDIFVFPSITETFGNVVLEAMSSGLPVVAAAKGGPLGIIENMKTGLLAQPENAADFCSKILYLLNNPERARKIVKNARVYALKQRWEFLSEDLLNYYGKLTGNYTHGQYEAKTK